MSANVFWTTRTHLEIDVLAGPPRPVPSNERQRRHSDRESINANWKQKNDHVGEALFLDTIGRSLTGC